MKNSLTYVLFLISGLIFSQNSVNSDSAYSVENSLLWKIDGNGLSQPSYLYGTMHFVCPDKFIIGDNVKDAINSSDIIYLEVDMDNPQTTKNAQILAMSNAKLSDKLSDSDFNYLDSLIQNKFNVAASNFNQVKPAFIYSMFMIPAFDCTPVSVENIILGNKKGKEVMGLESIEYQMNLLTRLINYDNVVQYLKEIDYDQLASLAESYYNQNINEINKISSESEFKNTEMYEELLLNRNNDWAKRLPDLMAENSLFVAVGAAHLGGNDGVIKKLRDQGYQVTPVN